MIEIRPTAREWDTILAGLPEPHILQTYEWGEVKEKYGWLPHFFIWKDDNDRINAAALILEKKVNFRSFASGFSILYAPRGPLLEWTNEPLKARMLNELKEFARKHRAIFIKIDPELRLGMGVPGAPSSEESDDGRNTVDWMIASGWRFSQDQIQFRNTAWLDLTGSEEDWLARMHQKTRYNLRLAQKKGVSVRVGGTGDLPLMYKMYAETSVRDGFVIRDRQYYLTVWRHFMEREMAIPLIAEVDGEAVAGIILFVFGKKAWYLYGMSRDAHREKMPNYLLQCEAMKLAKNRGCTIYDLWGAPDVFDGTDSMQGVFRFKEGLGATLIRTAGAWDYPARPWLYTLYTRILPRVLDLMRARGKEATRQQAGL